MYKLEIKKQIDLLHSTQLSSYEIYSCFAGFSYQLILDKSLFKHNSEIENFINNVFLEPHNIPGYKPYLYKSRTLLGARLSRLIIEQFTIDDINNAIDAMLTIFEEIFGEDFFKNSKKKHYNANYLDASLSSWIKETRLRSNGEENNNE